MKILLSSVLILALAGSAFSDPPEAPSRPMDRVMNRLYNFDFRNAHRLLDGHLAEQPTDSLAYAMRAATYLFHEMDRLKILESEFFSDDKKIGDKKNLKPDPNIKAEFQKALERSEHWANLSLSSNPKDPYALFALCLSAGLRSDYVALVEKKHWSSLQHTKKANTAALRLLQVDPKFHDAHLTAGINEYLVASLPFFVRWFVRIEQVEGDKQEAVRRLELVAKNGRYLGPFARILLSIIHLREKRPHETERLLAGLARDFPENPLIRKELAKISEKLQGGDR